ncbi:IS30 family transposase [Virgibacillus dokdonensis]|uniref:Integrase core domain protein n=3 Tax=Virgibacillus TaxID=84406 RepID=A0A2K9J319_9BACI|nr:IS30 family transposase [Virgibacillus dokdonensis]AUJ23924.1 Integrase core domain protein [Virgibacillus dokdonensis]AUJ24564.1 Integrase core domain protein [Virgibacillus dokdonensis]AUJ25094.1 Integrase core domain protein [Virgibacillus dokdonensis]AUJ25611.1 Integrase core domain protein [Virgibacillus dokdonensis]AUJ26266.1 Integrase core domain protein [Virgibacillus dokdonensis]
MSYTHLTKTELVFIEEYHEFGLSGRKIANKLKRGHEAVYRVIRQLKEGLTAIDVYLQYQANKATCGRKKIQLTPNEKAYIHEKVRDGWTPDVIIGRNEKTISCSMRTLYRKFSSGEFNQNDLPMQGKRKPNGHQERRGKQKFRRTILDRDHDHPNYKKEFGHLEGDTIVGRHHKSAVITLVERLTKCIIAIKPAGRQATNIETSLNQWFERLPKHLFKSIIFDCGKEFSNWKSISNEQDVDIYFADPGTPSQRGLNEHSNGLLRKNGLPKEMDFNPVSQEYISEVALRRNNIPRKSLKYKTPMECFIDYVGQDFDKSMLSRLI